MDKQAMLNWLEGQEGMLSKMARAIWEKPELAMEEVFASGLQRDALAAAGIDCVYRFKDLASPTFGGSRSRYGTFGMNQAARIEYKLYVRRRDLEWARAVIRGV